MTLEWRTCPNGGIQAFHPDGTLHATILPNRGSGVTATVHGRRLFYAAERFAFWEIEQRVSR